jgi:hypothetical protein
MNTREHVGQQIVNTCEYVHIKTQADASHEQMNNREQMNSCEQCAMAND